MLFKVFRSTIEDQRPCGVASECTGCGAFHGCGLPTHWRVINPMNTVVSVCSQHLPPKDQRDIIKNPFA